MAETELEPATAHADSDNATAADAPPADDRQLYVGNVRRIAIEKKNKSLFGNS